MMKRRTAALVATLLLAPATAPVALAAPMSSQNIQLPDRVPLSLPNVQSNVTGSSTGSVIVQHPGAPVPQPFTTDWLAGYISDISAYKYGVYLEINRLFPELKANRPDVMQANTDIVVEVNNNAKNDPELVAQAQRDAVASSSDLLAELSPALGEEFGRAFRDALKEHRLPKTEYLLGNGMTAEEYRYFLSNRLKNHCIMGNDYYVTNEHRVAPDGRGIVNLLAADKLMRSPRLYATFLLWLLSQFYETLPEVGDLDRPKLVFVFDEAHLLFGDAPAALQQRIEQVVRLVRSKGVGVYFCSQFPDDVPDAVLGQLGNRVQHALRAYTPRDQKAVRTAAQTFVANPALDVAATISTLGTGEALVSTLQDTGRSRAVPSPVERTLIAPPRCRMGPISESERATLRAASPVGTKYDAAVDRESAAELLARRATMQTEAAEAPKAAARNEGGVGQRINEWLFGTSRRQGVLEAAGKQAARTITSRIVRGVLGSFPAGRR